MSPLWDRMGYQAPIFAYTAPRVKMARGGEPLHRSLFRDITPYLCYILLATAVGPLQFGYHLVLALPCH